MEQGSIDRRRGRRVMLEAPLLIRNVGAQDLGGFREQTARNISLAGIYFETNDGETYTVDQQLIASVSIPETGRREFPFTRLAGGGRIVRITELPQQETTQGRKRLGIALEFGYDLIALTATPSRG